MLCVGDELYLKLLPVLLSGDGCLGEWSRLGEEVAIVTELPGTTRDLLRHTVNLDGLPVHLIDTAGLRAAADVIEAEGIRRARTEMERADHVLYVVDAAQPASAWADLSDLVQAVPMTLVFNKIDVAGAAPIGDLHGREQLRISARTGAGMDLLRAHLQAVAGYRSGDAGVISARRRHLEALLRARAAVESAAEVLRNTGAVELFAEDLRLAQRTLSEITGEFTSEDLLGEIFGSFCIGK